MELKICLNLRTGGAQNVPNFVHARCAKYAQLLSGISMPKKIHISFKKLVKAGDLLTASITTVYILLLDLVRPVIL